MSRSGGSKRNRRLVLFFDTFERLGLEAAPWLLDNFLKEKDINPNIVLVVAGRDLLYKTADQTSRWLEYRDDIKSFPLQFFDLEQTRLYLVQFGVTEPDEVKRIWEISGGLPFFLDLIVASPEDATNPTRDVVKRFLKWIPEAETVKRRLVTEAALFTQPFNQDDLEAFEYVGEGERAALYEWLSNLTFVRTNSAKGGCYYHDRARELFGREFYERTHKDYHNTRRAIAAYYQKQLENLEKDGGEEIAESSEWQETIKLLIEQLFLLPDETSHIKAMQHVLTLNSKTKDKQETISLLQQVIQESSNNRVNNGAVLLANLLVQYFERDYRDTEFLLVIKQLLAKVKTASFFPSEQTAKLYANKGVAYQQQGNYTQAILDFDQAISLNPKDAWAFGERGETYRQQGNYTQAIVDFDQAISLNPKDAWAFAMRGETYRQQGNYTQAIVDFDQAISLNPKDAWAFAMRGETYRQQGNYTQAIVDFDQAISLDPKNDWAFAHKGLAYQQQGNYLQAIADFDQAIALDLKDAWVFALRGLAYRQQGNYPQAIADFDQALSLDPKYAGVFAHRGQIYRIQSNYAQAIADFDQAISLDHKDARNFAHRGEAYRQQGNYPQAIADFDRAISLDPKYVWAFAHRGEAYRQQGNYPQAIADFDQAISLDHKDARNFAHRGKVYLQQGNYPQAIADFDRAISLDPKYVWAFAHRGEAYRQQGNYPQAIADFDQAISLDHKDARNFAHRGKVYLQQNNYTQAIADFDQAISLNPKDAETFAHRGEAYLQQENYLQAIADFDQAISLDPKYEWAFAKRGQIYRIQSNYAQAIADFDQAISLDPKDAWNFASRGAAYLGLENLAAAKKDFVYAAELDPMDAGNQLVIGWIDLLAGTVEEQEIITGLEKAFAAESEEYNAMVCGGVVYWLQNILTASLALLEEVIQQEPDDGGANFWLGLVRAEMGQDEEALALLKKALDDGMPPILLQTLHRVRGRPEFYEEVAKPALLGSE